MINLKQIVRGGLMLTALYGLSGCDTTRPTVSTDTISESSCPPLVQVELDPINLDEFEFRKGDYKIEVTNVDYGMQELGGTLTIKDLSGDQEKLLYQGYIGVLNVNPESLARFVNNNLFEKGKMFEKNNALECLLAPVSKKYEALKKEIKGN